MTRGLPTAEGAVERGGQHLVHLVAVQAMVGAAAQPMDDLDLVGEARAEAEQERARS